MSTHSVPFRSHRLTAALLALPFCPLLSGAATIVVPDQAPTIQAALYALPDTVVIRPGSYEEAPVVFAPVILTADSPDPARRPTLNGMLLEPALSSPTDLFGFCNLDFAGAVTIRNEETHCIIDFRLCRLGGGLSDVSFSDRTWDIRLTKCSIIGSVDLYALATCSVDSCDLTGGLKKVVLSTTHLFVTNSTFLSDGSADAAIRANVQRCQVVGNTIRGYGIGMSLRPEETALVSGNVVEDCYALGIAISQADNADVVANTVRRCGLGMDIAAGAVVASDNIVESCLAREALWVGEGMRIGAGNAILERNVIWGCEGGGLFVDFLGTGTSTVANNTICMNRGSGIRLRLNLLINDAQTEILQNVSAGNGGWGLLWLNPPEGRVSRLACNDWFGNLSGDVGGASLSVDDFSVDPMFCDSAGGDVRLHADSPLVDRPGCGLVGARGVGCDLTPTLVAWFSAERIESGVRIVWEVGADAPSLDVWVERSSANEFGPWERPATTRDLQGNVVVETDRTALLDRAYWYRLVGDDGGTFLLLGAPVHVGSVARLGFDLLRIGPSPASGPVRIEFTLGHPAPVDLEIFDVQGRSMASVVRGERSAGIHMVEWNGAMDAGGITPAGCYILRYRYPGGQHNRLFARSR